MFSFLSEVKGDDLSWKYFK